MQVDLYEVRLLSFVQRAVMLFPVDHPSVFRHFL